MSSSFDQLKESLAGQFGQLSQNIRRRIFGANNETLDFVMDSFYKLSPEQRLGALVGACAGGVVLVISVFYLYFSGVAGLERDLNKSFAALHELRSLQKEYNRADKQFQGLLRNVKSKTANLKVRPFVEEKAQSGNVEMQGLDERREPLPAESPLNGKIEYVRVSMRLPKISIPRLLNFVVDIERSGRFLSVEDLQVRERFGQKLYFDAQAKFRGYSVGR